MIVFHRYFNYGTLTNPNLTTCMSAFFMDEDDPGAGPVRQCFRAVGLLSGYQHGSWQDRAFLTMPGNGEIRPLAGSVLADVFIQ